LFSKKNRQQNTSLQRLTSKIPAFKKLLTKYQLLALLDRENERENEGENEN
jgi:hypothetical protein